MWVRAFVLLSLICPASALASGPGFVPAVKPFGDAAAANTSVSTISPDGTQAATLVTADSHLQVAVTAPGGTAQVATVGDGVQSGSQHRIVAGPGGSIAVGFQRSDGFYVAVKAPGGTFGAPVAVPDALDLSSMVLGPGGRLWWLSYPSTALTVETLVPGDITPTKFPLTSGASANSYASGVAPRVTSDGAVHVAWTVTQTTSGGGGGCSQTTTLYALDGGPSGFTPSAATALATATLNNPSGTPGPGCAVGPSATGDLLGSVNLAAAPGGDLTVVWSDTFTAGPSSTTGHARHRAPGAAWGSAENLPYPYVSALTYAGSRPLMLAYNVSTYGISGRNADGTWTTPAGVGALGYYVQFVGSPSGKALLAYLQGSGSTYKVMAALVDGPTATPAAAVALSATTDLSTTVSSAAMDDAGNAVVGWLEHQSSGYTAWTGRYDGAGPLLAPSPTTALTGVPVTLASGAADVMSALGAVHWDFGDGSTGDGASVAHTFAAAGTYAVKLSAIDALAQPAQQTFNVVVSDPIPPAAPAPSPSPPTTGTASPPKPLSFLGKLVVKPSKVRHGKSLTVSFALSGPATVKGVLSRKVTGVRRGRLCLTGLKRRKGQKACTKTVSGKSTSAKVTGAGKLTVSTKGLKPGRYTLTLTAAGKAATAAVVVT